MSGLTPSVGDVPLWDGAKYIFVPLPQPIPGPRGKGGGCGMQGPPGPPGPSGAGGPPSGPAGGDLFGTYPNPGVDGFQTVPISGAVPTAGDMWIYDGPSASWMLSGTDLDAVRIVPGGGGPTMTWGNSVLTDFEANVAGADAFSWTLATNTPPGIGARASGGAIAMSTGAGNGNAGAGASGGDFTRDAGNGSSGGGAGGSILESTGDGGAGGGSAGVYRLVLGIPDAGGNEGTWEVFQGGPAGDPTLLLDGNGQLHIGKDSDTSAGPIRLRVNGQTITTVGVGGAADPMPTPVGYLRVDINGTVRVIAFFNNGL